VTVAEDARAAAVATTLDAQKRPCRYDGTETHLRSLRFSAGFLAALVGSLRAAQSRPTPKAQGGYLAAAI